MGKLGPIIMIVFGVFMTGIYWRLWDESIVYLEPYIIEDAYYNLIRLGWDMIPVVVLIVGIIWLIKQGTGSTRQRVVYE